MQHHLYVMIVVIYQCMIFNDVHVKQLHGTKSETFADNEVASNFTSLRSQGAGDCGNLVTSITKLTSEAERRLYS